MADDLGVPPIELELQTLTGGKWLVVQESSDLELVRANASKLSETQDFDGVRVVRRLSWPDYEFVSYRIVSVSLKHGVREPEPWTPVVAPNRPVLLCESDDDLIRDEARALIHPFLVTYLEEAYATLLEVMHHEAKAELLMNAGTLVQSVVQRVALVQAQVTGKSVGQRMRELETIVTSRLRRLRADGQAGQPHPLRPGKFEEGLLAVEARYGADSTYHSYRAVAHYLAGAKTWAEKLDRLFELYEPLLDARHYRIIDRIGQELLMQAGTVREITQAGGRRRVDRMIGLVDLMNGRFNRPLDELPVGLRALAKLILEGGMPRCREALRDRLLKEITARVNLTNEASLSEEMRALLEFYRHVEKESPYLLEELEFNEAIKERVERMLHLDFINEYMAGVKPLRDKLDRLLILAEASPIDLGRVRVAGPIRNILNPDDLIRDFVAPQKDRSNAIPTLAQLAQRFAAVGFESQTESEFLSVLDGILYDILRNDVLKARATPMDRMQRLVRLCTQPPLQPGKARKFAGEAIRAAIGSPEFAKSYAERFPNEKERADALNKLRELLRSAGLLVNG